MFDLINGIPVHPLVVHAVVVLLPLAVVGTLAIALRPRWRVRYGPLVVGAALLSTVLIPVATSSGEELEKRVGDVDHHAEMGEMLIWFAIPLLVSVTALWWLARRQERAGTAAASGTTEGGTAPSKTLVSAVAALAVVAALASAFQVYRVGDSGAKAVWEDSTSSTTGG
jgi:uncharacterized membrane protein